MAKLSESVMAEIKDAVNIFDRVGDGKVDVKDIVNLLRSLGMILHLQKLQFPCVD